MGTEIHRLRETQEARANRATEAGRRAGRVWARGASEAQLKRLAAYLADDANSWAGRPDHRGWPGVVCDVLSNDAWDHKKFWEQVLGDRWDTKVYDEVADADERPAPFLVGWVEGAVEFWTRMGSKRTVLN